MFSITEACVQSELVSFWVIDVHLEIIFSHVNSHNISRTSNGFFCVIYKKSFNNILSVLIIF